MISLRPHFLELRPLDVGATAAALVCEPSLSMCSPGLFEQHAGSVAKRTLGLLRACGALEEQEAFVERQPEFELRITARTLWIEPGEVPHPRREWHLDRHGSIAKADGDPRRLQAEFALEPSIPGFISLTSFGTDEGREAEGAPLTEFLPVAVELDLDDPYCSAEVLSRAAQRALAGLGSLPEIRRVEPGHPVQFNGHVLHRPGIASAAGWRQFFRIGVYKKRALSPFRNHRLEVLVCCCPDGSTFARPANRKERIPVPRAWSRSL